MVLLKRFLVCCSNPFSFPPGSASVVTYARQKMITNNHIRVFNIYFLPFILFVTTYGVFGFYYGDSDDPVIEALIRGLFFSHPVTEFFSFHRITAVAYAHLYQLFPNIPWYGISMYALLLLAVTNYFVLIHRQVEKFITNYALLTPLLTIFYLVFFLDGVIYIFFTKVAILLAASSILLILDGMLKADDIRRLPYWHAAWYFLLFTLGFLTRPQAGLLCIFLLLPFAVLYHPGKRRLLRALYVFVALFSVVGVLKIYDYSTWTKGSEYYWSVSPYIVNIYDFRHEGKNLDGPQDSIKYRAVTRLALSDREMINVGFLSRISSDQLIDIGRLKPIELARAVRTIGDNISRYQLLIVFVILAAASVVLIVNRHELPFICRLKFVTFSFLYWSGVVLLAAFWKMPDRVLSPIVVAYITGSLLFISTLLDYFKLFKASHRVSASSRVIASLWIVTCFALIFAGYRKIPTTKMRVEGIAQMSMLRELINREFEGKILVFSNLAAFLVNQSLLTVGHLSSHNRYIFVDGSWLSLLPEYPQHLKEITGSDRLSDAFDFLLQNREKVIFVSSPYRNAFIQEYFSSIYNRDFEFEEFKKKRRSERTPVIHDIRHCRLRSVAGEGRSKRSNG